MHALIKSVQYTVPHLQVPESPAYLAAKGHLTRADEALRKLRGPNYKHQVTTYFNKKNTLSLIHLHPYTYTLTLTLLHLYSYTYTLTLLHIHYYTLSLTRPAKKSQNFRKGNTFGFYISAKK